MTDDARKRTSRTAIRPKQNNQVGGIKPLAGCGAHPTQQSGCANQPNMNQPNGISYFGDWKTPDENSKVSTSIPEEKPLYIGFGEYRMRIVDDNQREQDLLRISKKMLNRIGELRNQPEQ